MGIRRYAGLALGIVALLGLSACAGKRPQGPREMPIQQISTTASYEQEPTLENITRQTNVFYVEGGDNHPTMHVVPRGFVQNLERNHEEIYNMNDVYVRVPDASSSDPTATRLVELEDLSLQDLLGQSFQAYFGDTREKIGSYSGEMPYIMLTRAEHDILTQVPDFDSAMGVGVNDSEPFIDSDGLTTTDPDGDTQEHPTYQSEIHRPTLVNIIMDPTNPDTSFPRGMENVSAGYSHKIVERLQATGQFIKTPEDLRAIYVRSLAEAIQAREGYFDNPRDLKSHIYVRKSQIEGNKIVIEMEDIIGILLYQNHIGGLGYGPSGFINPATSGGRTDLGHWAVRVQRRRMNDTRQPGDSDHGTGEAGGTNESGDKGAAPESVGQPAGGNDPTGGSGPGNAMLDRFQNMFADLDIEFTGITQLEHQPTEIVYDYGTEEELERLEREMAQETIEDSGSRLWDYTAEKFKRIFA